MYNKRFLCARMIQHCKTGAFMILLFFPHHLTLLLCVFSFSQTPVPAAPVSMATVVAVARVRLIPVSVVKSMREKGVISLLWTYLCPTGILLHPLPQSRPHLPRPQLPLILTSQPLSPPPHKPHLPCSRGNQRPDREFVW